MGIFNIAGRIRLLIVLAVCIGIASSLVLYLQVVQGSSDSKATIAGIKTAMLTASELVGESNHAQADLLLLFREKDPDAIEKIVTERDSLEKLVETGLANRNVGSDTVSRLFDSLKIINAKIVEKTLLGDQANAQEMFIEKSAIVFQKFLETIEKSQLTFYDHLEQNLKKKESATKTVQIITIIGVFTAILALLVFGFFISRGITGPISKTSEMIKEMAEGDGDLTRRLPVNGNDEMAVLSRRFNAFVGKLQDLMKEISANSSKVTSASGDLASVTTELAATAEEMTAQSNTVAGASEEATSNVNNISASAEEMSRGVTSVATAIEEMSSSLNEVAQNCQKEVQIANDTNTRTRDTQELMNRLNESAQAIGKVVDVINDISDQINLLALNATIEAASAGDAGKGFTVVANEVKELAKQTAHATDEISVQIREMQNNTTNSIKAIESVAAKIEEINSISQSIVAAVEEQSATINEIAKSINGADGAASEIARNVSESGKGLREVASNILGVNTAARETASGVARIKRGMDDFARLGEALRKSVGQFKV
jgi:methyl-accepting chemotaxis protein